ncbi:DUF2953 domain-containing protein [Clostridium rectalis]|uniref:DUF2953 domain-containing protein n=1 Tax=Clostridium rectalis TaxID=2040295 RepID=UPI000F638057|nr:DUF2953 domain-containing protein [Clostridium rectalis]
MMLIFLILLFVILFFPFSIKINFKYEKNKISVKFLKKEFNLSTKNGSKDILTFKHHMEEMSSKKNIDGDNAKIIMEKFKKNIFKPKLTTNITIGYGLSDAAITAILNGLIYSLYPFVFNILNFFFNLKHIDLKVNPVFNKEFLYIEIQGIIFINLVKIIHIGLLIFFSLHSRKKTLKGSNAF